MAIAARIKKLLDATKLAYRVFPHTRVSSLAQAMDCLQLDPAMVVASQVLVDEHGMVLVVLPISTKIDILRLRRHLNRDLKIQSAVKTNRVFNDCDAGCWPPIGQAYGLEVYIDNHVQDQEWLYFTSGSNTSMLQMHIDDFLYLNSRAKFLDFADKAEMDLTPLAELTGLSGNSLAFPELPPVALKILQLSIDGEHSIRELVEIISEDPFIHQQIENYSQLPFVQDKTESEARSMQHITEHVLGFDTVSHIALGVAVGRAFNMREPVSDGGAFWRHAFYAAVYSQRITKLVDRDLKLDPELSYLAGMFHNFGFLLFSQLFPPEYKLLQKWMTMNPKTSVAILEKRLLGMGQAFNVVRGGHAQLGEWLLRHWRMPEAICVVAKEHHSLSYKGPYSPYVKIIQITNQLLKEDGIGDGSAGGLSAQLLEPLGLNAEQVIASVQDIRNATVGLDQIAQLLSDQ